MVSLFNIWEFVPRKLAKWWINANELDVTNLVLKSGLVDEFCHFNVSVLTVAGHGETEWDWYVEGIIAVLPIKLCLRQWNEFDGGNNSNKISIGRLCAVCVSGDIPPGGVQILPPKLYRPSAKVIAGYRVWLVLVGANVSPEPQEPKHGLPEGHFQ